MQGRGSEGLTQHSQDTADAAQCTHRINTNNASLATQHTPLTHTLPLLLPRLWAPAVAITASNMKQPNKQAHTPLMCHDAT